MRAERLLERLDGAGVDAILVTHLVNVRCLSGFSGTRATQTRILTPLPGELVVVD